MWMSDPIPVMTRIISDDRWSRRSVSGICRSPDAIQRNSVTSVHGSPTFITESPDTANDASMTRQATPPDTVFARRLPRKALTTKPANGSSGISASMSPLQRRESFGTERLPVPEQRDDQRQAHRRLGRRHRHDEEGDDLPVHRADVAPGGDEGQVHRVQHDLDRQQDR